MSGNLMTVPSEVIREEYRRALVMLKLNPDDFYKAYTEVMKLPELQNKVATGDQDTAIIGLVAHVMSNISSEYFNKIKTDEQNFEDVAVLFGTQGSGKSSVVLGTAMKIAQMLLSQNYDAKKCKVLIASNLKSQVQVLKDTMREFEVDTFSEAVNSTNDGSKWTPRRLLDLYLTLHELLSL